MNMKKYAVVLTAAALALSLSACGKSDAPATPAASTAAPAPAAGTAAPAPAAGTAAAPAASTHK